MNLYECIMQVSSCIKEKNEVKELIKKYETIKKLKKDIKYNCFFSLIDLKEFYNFFAPNITMQIINNIYKNNDFSILGKKECELIINNQDIKEYVEISTRINQIISNEIMSLLTPEQLKKDLKTEYIYNRLSEKLGKVGLIEILKVIDGKGNEAEQYFDERNKIIEPSIKLFPIYNFNNEFLDKMNKINISKQIIDSIEKFNLMLYIIERIIYCDIYDKIIFLKKENIQLIKEDEKLNIIVKKILIKDQRLVVMNFPIIVLHDNYYFPYSLQYDIWSREATINVFTCKLEEKKSLLNLSIVNTIDLFQDD